MGCDYHVYTILQVTIRQNKVLTPLVDQTTIPNDSKESSVTKSLNDSKESSVTTETTETEQLEYEHERRYILSFDDDDETYEEYLERKMDEEEEEKLLFSEGKWLIKNADKIEEYKKFIEDATECRYHYALKNKIQMDDVITIKRVKEAVSN